MSSAAPLRLVPDQPEHPDPEARAFLTFLAARLADVHRPDPATARRVGATLALIEAYANHQPQPEIEGWSRGFADGILLGLLAAAQEYRDHPDWQKEWDE